MRPVCDQRELVVTERGFNFNEKECMPKEIPANMGQEALKDVLLVMDHPDVKIAFWALDKKTGRVLPPAEAFALVGLVFPRIH